MQKTPAIHHPQASKGCDFWGESLQPLFITPFAAICPGPSYREQLCHHAERHAESAAASEKAAAERAAAGGADGGAGAGAGAGGHGPDMPGMGRGAEDVD